MMRGFRILPLAVLTVALVLLCASSANTTAVLSADVLVTAAPVYVPQAALTGGERFPQGAQIERIHAGHAEPLVAGFAATADAQVSCDAKSVLFAGKKLAADPWQIWQLTLAGGALTQLTHSAADSIRPFYLPAGRIVFAERAPYGFMLKSLRITDEDKYLSPALGAEFALTPSAISAIPDDVLADGRILFESSYPLGVLGGSELYLIYSDGSGVESYRCDHGSARWAGSQLASGDVVFTHGDTLARFTSPLAHEEVVAVPRRDYAGSIAELPDRDWLVSARASASEPFALELLKPGASTLVPVFSQRGMHMIEPVVLAPRERPHHHPSALHPWSYANLLALDARLSRDGALAGTPATVRVEGQNPDGTARILGAARVESDGSFYVRVPGNTPVRYSLLDVKGNVLRTERGWTWSAPGEQRICTGCHTGPERAPDNKVPAVLLRTIVPADMTGAEGGSSK